MEDLIFLCSSTVTRGLSFCIRRTSGIDTTAQQLVREGTELKARWDEVERSVAAAERQQWVPRSEVKRWLERTEGVLRDLDDFEGRYWEWRDQFHGPFGFLLTCGCPLFCSYALGARAADILMQAQELKGQRIDLEAVARPPPLLPVEKIPASTLRIIGPKAILDEIRGCLRDETVRVIGICGMGGVGKTTLLTDINNDVKFLTSTGVAFHMVIWATVTYDFSAENLQRDIARRCGLSLAQSDRRDWPQLLFNFLSAKRFLLILDDVWTAFDLAKVGIPLPDAKNKSKVVFATRSEHVYSEMDADKRIQVDPLNEDDSWELFRTRVPREVLDLPSIREHAQVLVATCGGLPLALTRVGRTMANKRTSPDWELARRTILESPTELRGMTEVINSLKLSFDRLTSDRSRRCLHHCCSVFPDGHDLDVEALIDSFIERGLLRDAERAMGYDVIGDLEAMFLLQTYGEGKNKVNIHPMVRITALHCYRMKP